ncbi:hypothetical protein HELRODRAFT_84161, partial [Helobdella robusta]|uniref:Uncharacterized protein n=1 Tax=Helobdella robusta TaxID=6412 RepID=T1G5F6_HELRO
LMKQLYTQGWYNSWPTKNWRESLQTSDHVSIRLGVARLRQLRIKENTCRIEKQFQKLIRHCRTDYNWLDDDAASYDTGWSSHNPWLYRDSTELKSAPYVGQVNTYKGGGYVFNFYCNPQKSLRKLADLQSNNWLDVKTRALLVEFTVYNGNANLFGSVIMLLEFLSNGMPVVSQEVKVFKISSYVGAFGIIVAIFQVIYVGFVIYFLVHIINLMRKQKREYFRSFWNWLELLTAIMSIVTIAMYGMKMIFGSTAMDVLKETGSGDYVNFVTIGLWAETYGIVLAIVVFLATLKFINMLKFNRRLSMLTETIKFSVKDMKTFVITFFIYLLAFGQLGYLLFSSKLVTYKSFSSVIETLFQFFIGSFTFSDYPTAQPILGPIFFFLFVWVIIYGMQSMFLVIIVEAFQAVRKENQFKRNDYEVGEYMIGKVKGLFGQ